MKLMQTNAANTDPEIVKMHYIQMAELWKLPELADKVRNFQPKPDPQQQELMALQIEEVKLKNALLMKQMEDVDSKIFERLSRTEENTEADIAMKQAKARKEVAAASKLEAETDVIDQEFLNVQTGQARVEALEDKAIDASYKVQEKAAGRPSGISKDIKLVL